MTPLYRNGQERRVSMKQFDFKKYVEYKVYSVTTIKKGYGFCVLLKFTDGTEKPYSTLDFLPKEKGRAAGMKS